MIKKLLVARLFKSHGAEHRLRVKGPIQKLTELIYARFCSNFVHIWIRLVTNCDGENKRKLCLEEKLMNIWPQEGNQRVGEFKVFPGKIRVALRDIS